MPVSESIERAEAGGGKNDPREPALPDYMGRQCPNDENLNFGNITSSKYRFSKRDAKAFLIAKKPLAVDDTRKDERLIILLGIGFLFFVIFCYRYYCSPAIFSRAHVRIQMEGQSVVVTKSHPDEEEKVSISEVPPALAPLFYAPVPINFADRELLETINGIGPHLATEIVRTRYYKGPFSSPEDLLQVPGIGPKKMDKFAKLFSYEQALPNHTSLAVPKNENMISGKTVPKE